MRAIATSPLFRRHVLLLLWPLVTLFACASTGPATAPPTLADNAPALADNAQAVVDNPPAVLKPPTGCEYINIYVDPDSYVFEGNMPAVDSLQKRFLEISAAAATRVGYRIVEGPSEAYFRLRAGANVMEQPFTLRMRRDSTRVRSGRVEKSIANRKAILGVMLDPSLKLQHHMFVTMLDDPQFPYRGSTGTELTWQLDGPGKRKVLEQWADHALQEIWARDAKQITALCAARDEFVEEGWTAIKELRNELILEIKKKREERAAQTLQKKLKFEIEAE